MSVEKREYIAKFIKSGDKVDTMSLAPIDNFPWGNEYTPKAFGGCSYIEGKGLLVHLECFEDSPKAVFENYGDSVYKDSCLEFFAAFNNNSKKYLNFEMNSKGAYLASVRTCKADKKNIDLFTDDMPVVNAKVTKGFWSVEVLLSEKMISDCFDGTKLSKGSHFYGNFYKCGDETPIPHYGCWSPIENETPQFHLPEFFGKITIE